MVHRYGHTLTIVAGLALAIAGMGCDGSSPLGRTNGAEDSTSDDSGLNRMAGFVESADLSGTEGILVLEGDVQVRVTSKTTIDGDGDLTSIDEARAAIEAGEPVRIEIEGTFDDGVFTATRIRFETDGPIDDDEDGDEVDDDDGDEIHGIVATVDLGARTVTLTDGRVLRVGTDALIEVDGDFLTLTDVQSAVVAGLEVEVEADGEIASGGVFEVASAKFESDEADGPGDDDGDDDGDDGQDDDDQDDDGDEVHGIVATVDLGARTVTLADGRVLRVGTGALIEVDGDFLTLTDVQSAVAAGLEVEVEADGGIAADGVFEVTSAKFESDQADGPADDDEDEDEDGGDDNSGPGNHDDADDDDNSGPGNHDDADDDEDDEVHGFVAAVDLGARTVTLTDGRLISIASDAVIDAGGDIDTLAGVQAQLSLGGLIRFEADGAFEGGMFVATDAEFEVD